MKAYQGALQLGIITGEEDLRNDDWSMLGSQSRAGLGRGGGGGGAGGGQEDSVSGTNLAWIRHRAIITGGPA